MSKLSIAYGMMSMNAIDIKSAPEKLMAMDITLPYLKQLSPDITRPKISTSMKNAPIRAIFMTVKVSIMELFFPFLFLLKICAK